MDVIHRLKDVIVEVERMTDHVLLIGHRVVARVLLAYFKGLDRSLVTSLDVPLGHLYVLEPVSLPLLLKTLLTPLYSVHTEWKCVSSSLILRQKPSTSLTITSFSQRLPKNRSARPCTDSFIKIFFSFLL